MTVTAATLKGPEATISDASLEGTRMRIRGDVLTPETPGFETVRAGVQRDASGQACAGRARHRHR